jgi:hypothetical protein
MPPRRIARARARSDFIVEITWTDGERSVLSLDAIVDRGASGAARMRNPGYFVCDMVIVDGGRALAWGDAVFEADALWRAAQQHTTA